MINRMRDDDDDDDQGDYGQLVMIDAIQRLTLDHHFNEEIQEMLQKHHHRSLIASGSDHLQLHEAALSFRLLRQHGYHVPAGKNYSFHFL